MELEVPGPLLFKMSGNSDGNSQLHPEGSINILHSVQCSVDAEQTFALSITARIIGHSGLT